MNPTLPLWVLAVGATTTSAPVSSVPRPALDITRLSAQWSVSFTRVPAAPGARPSAGAAIFAERIEALLDTARTALGSLRPEEAKAALADSETLLRAHPELPQAAWLAAEHATIAAELAASSDDALVESARLRAFILEGRRAPAFREGQRAESELPLPAPVTLEVRGLAAGDELEWDSASTASSLTVRPGEHQLRVLRSGRLLWASWIEVSPRTREVTLNLPELAPCSADDLGATHDGGSRPIAPRSTSCPRWAVARVNAGHAEIAFCERSSCQAWQREPARPTSAPARTESARGGVPAWALYVAGGLGAAAIGGIIAAQAGAFDSSPPRERWRYEGLR